MHSLNAARSSTRCLLAMTTRSALALTRRALTARQAAVALLPFYRLVHPDGFGREPEIRANNERALQIFNGYLNECLSASASFSLKPTEVIFTMRHNDGTTGLEQVRIPLSGVDPTQIVRIALERCRISTEHLPPPAPRAYSTASAHSWKASFSSTTAQDQWSDVDDLWRRLHDTDLRRRKRSAPYRPPPSDLSAWATRRRADALERSDAFERTREQLEDRIHEIVRKTGLKEILWAINWDQSYMRRCLASIEDMISQADSNQQQTITYALMNRTLILGRGSHVCCDGSLQFGADDATGAWQKVCMETNVRTFELRHLRLLTARVREIFGGAQLVVPSHASLIATTEQMKTLIVRVSLRPSAARERIAESAGADALVEVVNAYSELALLRDGRVQIPCNVDGEALEAFLEAHIADSRVNRRRAAQQKAIITDLSRHCCSELALHSLTWDAELDGDDALVDSLRRLADVASDDASTTRSSLRNLALHFSRSPDVHLTPSGRLSVPIDWT